MRERFMLLTRHLQSKTKIAETPVFCFIGSVNKHINFYDISRGLLKGKKAIPQDTASSSHSIWFAESRGRMCCVSVSTKKVTLQVISDSGRVFTFLKKNFLFFIKKNFA